MKLVVFLPDYHIRTLEYFEWQIKHMRISHMKTEEGEVSWKNAELR